MKYFPNRDTGGSNKIRDKDDDCFVNSSNKLDKKVKYTPHYYNKKRAPKETTQQAESVSDEDGSGDEVFLSLAAQNIMSNSNSSIPQSFHDFDEDEYYSSSKWVMTAKASKSIIPTCDNMLKTNYNNSKNKDDKNTTMTMMDILTRNDYWVFNKKNFDDTTTTSVSSALPPLIYDESVDYDADIDNDDIDDKILLRKMITKIEDADVRCLLEKSLEKLAPLIPSPSSSISSSSASSFSCFVDECTTQNEKYDVRLYNDNYNNNFPIQISFSSSCDPIIEAKSGKKPFFSVEEEEGIAEKNMIGSDSGTSTSLMTESADLNSYSNFRGIGSTSSNSSDDDAIYADYTDTEKGKTQCVFEFDTIRSSVVAAFKETDYILSKALAALHIDMNQI